MKSILASIDRSGTCILPYTIDSSYLYPCSSLLVAVPPFLTFILARHSSSDRKTLSHDPLQCFNLSPYSVCCIRSVLDLVHF